MRAVSGGEGQRREQGLFGRGTELRIVDIVGRVMGAAGKFVTMN